jgi:hypothetical protein
MIGIITIDRKHGSEAADIADSKARCAQRVRMVDESTGCVQPMINSSLSGPVVVRTIPDSVAIVEIPTPRGDASAMIVR